MEIAIICFLFVLWLFSIFVSFYLGGLTQDAKLAKQASHIAFATSFWAITEAKALKNATVIRSIIEKYNVVEKKDSEELSKAAKEMEKAFEESLEGLGKTKKNGSMKHSEDLFNPDDLV